ncbi:hypothetical protein E4U24_002518 [Claviceps purpurea]|nr:hypothetical protein E4U38_004200 [Claviceps purpurea]KAG6158833.1 hypothetical protein E4U11_004528 [Claviceps purpurea]KAG6174640.1 hypothetical protein E4U51_001113 [Claviceps purpurea]KAG6179728.1 hypothetical protein E4U27_003079 [Claviceps purpurea]KAG6181287.1 hypothetical protein E4U10_007346 [Claviceps purpurea]
MFSEDMAESALSGPENHLLPDYCHADLDTTAKSNASSAKIGNRVESLDGLRGIACIAVFNYHFFWPWTKSIMLGYGFRAPLSLETYNNWLSLPIICLLHRGRPMVAIFFAISGYVLCRHILRSIHDRNRNAAYRYLSSAVFRRLFRLYIPPTISMLLVALLAQTGAFRSEKSVYTGYDSAYINGSLIDVRPGSDCAPGSIPLVGVLGVANFLGLPNPERLSNSSTPSDMLCLRRVSKRISPFDMYDMMAQLEPTANTNSNPQNLSLAVRPGYQSKEPKEMLPKAVGRRKSNFTTLQWARFGGSWEEHPSTGKNLTTAIQDFSRAYAEWANPFNFNHYHTRYDPHTYTMPIEFRGSMLIYLFLLGTLGIKTIWRLSIAGVMSVYSLVMGRWDMSIFLGATMLSDIEIWSSPKSAPIIADYTRGKRSFKLQLSPRRTTIIRWLVAVVALYLLSYPDAGAEYTPGFVFLSQLVPRYYPPLSRWMFYQSIGALLLVPCILKSRRLCKLLETSVAQYLGKMSFSIYLVHGPLLHSLGFWIMPRLFERFGRTGGYLVGWAGLFSTTMYLAQWWYQKVDVWSTTVGKRLEKHFAN